METMMDSERARIARLQHWRDAWFECAACVQRRAEERAIAWQESHIPERFQDVMPWQLPERLWHRYHRQEIKYGEHLDRASHHHSKAEACEAEIGRIRQEASARRPRQPALF
jgi:hypothetical protein